MGIDEGEKGKEKKNKRDLSASERSENLHIPTSLCVNISISLYLYLSVSLPLYLSISLSLYLCICVLE